MRKISNWLKRSGEAFLWIAFLAAIVISMLDKAPTNSTTVAGLLALAAIGVRATRIEQPADTRQSDATE